MPLRAIEDGFRQADQPHQQATKQQKKETRNTRASDNPILARGLASPAAPTARDDDRQDRK